MKKILILGGFGFIGSNVMQYIDRNLSKHYEVIVFDRFNQHPNGLSFKCLTKVYSGSFEDTISLQQIFDQHKISLVLHFINTTVPTTSHNIRFDIESNLISTIEFLNIMKVNKVRDIVFLSSGGAVYSNSINKQDELSQNFPISSYGIVKLAIEKYLMLFSQQGELSPLILRLSNPYGPLHYSLKQGVVNVALRVANNRQQFSIWGDGSNRKDYIYISDFCSILFKLIDKEIHNEIINVGSGQLITINDMMTKIKYLYPDFNWVYSEAKLNDLQNISLDLTKLTSILGKWEFTSFDAGIAQTNDWLKSETN